MSWRDYFFFLYSLFVCIDVCEYLAEIQNDESSSVLLRCNPASYSLKQKNKSVCNMMNGEELQGNNVVSSILVTLH